MMTPYLLLAREFLVLESNHVRGRNERYRESYDNII